MNVFLFAWNCSHIWLDCPLSVPDWKLGLSLIFSYGFKPKHFQLCYTCVVGVSLFVKLRKKICLLCLARHLSNTQFLSFAGLVCVCQWLFWTNSFWKMVYRSLQCGKTICVPLVTFIHECFLSKQSLSKSSPLKFCNFFFLNHLLDVYSNASSNSRNIWEILPKRKHAEIPWIIQDFPKCTGL